MSNPVINREFLGILRTRKALAMLLTLTLAFSIVVLLRWPTDGRIDLLGMRSQQVFQIFAYTLLAGVLFVVPAFPAVAIVQEKNRGTLALLLNSPLRAWRIYAGKLVASLLFAALVLSTSLPAAAACYAMGGVDLASQLGMLYAVLLSASLQYVTLGLLVSTYSQSNDSAVRITYSIVFAISVLAAGPHYLLHAEAGLWSLLAGWVHAVSPVPLVMEIAGHGGVGTLALSGQGSTAGFYFTSVLATSAAFVIATLARLNHRLFDRARPKGTITQERDRLGRGIRRAVFLIDPQRRKAGIPWYLNPVMVKEFRTRKFGRIHWLLRLVAACAVLSLLLTLSATTGVVDWGVATIGGFMVLLQMLLVVMITPSIAAALISAERESGGWELLRMTPMSPVKIVRGKLLSVFWTVGLILLATVPGYIVMIYIQPAIWLQVYRVLICLLLAAVYTALLSAAIGSLFRRTVAATTVAYLVLIVLFLGPLLIWLGRDAPFSHDFVAAALLLNPTAAALQIIETPGFGVYELMPAAWWVSGVVSAIALLGLGIQVWHLSRPV